MKSAFRIPSDWKWVWAVAAGGLVLLGFDAVSIYVSAPTTVVANNRVQIEGQSTPRASLQPILDFQPFGALAQQTEADVPVEAETPPESVVNITLQGILLRPDAAASRAIVSADGGAAKSYAVGDVLPGGGMLYGIKEDQILVQMGAETQSLTFPEPGAVLQRFEDDASGLTRENSDSLEKSDIAVLVDQPDVRQPDLLHLIPGLVPQATDAP